MTTLALADRWLSPAAVAAIRGYQRWLSPRKGFACAHRVRTGGESCSQAVLRAVREDGLLGARPRIRAAFAACHEAHGALRAQAALDGARFGDAGWADLGAQALHHGLQARTFCIPTPIGCCWFSG